MIKPLWNHRAVALFGPQSDLSQCPKPPMHLDRLWRTVAAESKADGSAKLQ